MRARVRTRLPSILAPFAIVSILAACSGEKTTDETYVEKPVEQLYNGAMDQLSDRSYTDAIKQFDEVDRQHPYSVWATKAELMTIYANYQSSKYEDAIASADRFIQLHPGNRDAAYAYYLKAVSSYEQIVDVQRDQKMTQRALDALQDVIRRFPDSRYARDAKLKLDLTQDHLAGKEMAIGRYYERRGEYLAALNRFKTVVDKYQTTSQVPEALHRLVEVYLALGLKTEAKATAAVLGYNFPNSEWYKDTFALVGDTTSTAARPGWFARNVGSIF